LHGARLVAAVLVVAVALQGLALTAGAQAEEAVPRHPPVLIPDPVQPVATIIADRYDLAYLARLGYSQAQYVAQLTGGELSAAYRVASALNNLNRALLNNDWRSVWASLDILKSILVNMSSVDLRFLASQNTITLPACKGLLGLEGPVLTEVYTIENPYEEANTYSFCAAPTTTLQLYSALDTSLSLLSMLHNKTVAPGVFIVILVHVPPEAAYPEVVQAIIEGRLTEQVLQAAVQEPDIQATVEALLEQVQTGDKDQALEALRQLLDLARSGVIDWDVYAQALRTYNERFGEPPQIQEPATGGEEEVNVDLNELLRQMQSVVEAAEKARLEAAAEEEGGGGSIMGRIAITPPDPTIIALGGLLLAASIIYRERERVIPQTVLPRVLAGKPPRGAGAEWCYRALVEVLRVRGLPKEEWETPEEYLERIRDRLDPETLVLAEELTSAFEREVYGGERVEVDAEECVRRLRGVLLRWPARRGG